MAHAPTGLGKTDAALSAAISYAIENNLSVFFLTPKISQHKIAVDVVRGIADKHSLPIRVADMLGRSHCCIDSTLQNLDNESFHTACSRKRKNKECQFYINARGHGRDAEAKADARFRVMLQDYGSGKNHGELIELGREKLSCPYEWLLKLSETSNVIIADYYHLMIPQIRDIFLSKVKKRLEDSIVIVDEAHNLASRVRSSLSYTVSDFTMMRVVKEMRFLGLDSGPIAEEFGVWAAELTQNANEYEIQADALQSFIGRFGLDNDEAIDRLEKAGAAFVEKTNRKSACIRLANFFSGWAGEEKSVRIIKKKNGHFFLSKKLLDPSPATRSLNHSRSSILMSGTLLPISMHRDVLGLSPERTVMKTYSSPFSRSSILNIVTEDLTTRYSRRDFEGYSAIAKAVDSVVSKTPGGTAVFFPSYKVMDKILPIMLSRNLIVQKSGMKPSEVRQMIKDFGGGGVLCAVQGGSFSEGVDYSAGEIKTVIIVGVALEEMGIEVKALINHYEEEFGRGWDYGYLYPGTIKALQAAGRARRKETDRVAVVYMDERFKWNKYNWILDKNEKVVVTNSPEQEVEKFWAK